ncbi:DUF3822 family protein [Flagellimonas sp.]|uniref:DUF3822 family protein n=1 Tax=Flagellimonas sp. TaxID=2058762 RepID=UPI003F4A1E38
MTEKGNNTIEDNFKKLSIQVGLNGLSFCALDTISKKILAYENIPFKTTSTPYLLLKELKDVLNAQNLANTSFKEVMVVHKNGFFSMVPKPLFNKEELPNYLKFNAKMMANDLVVFDELDNHDLVNVYIPYANVNNYVFDLFGEFTFKHNGSVLVSSLLDYASSSTGSYCYVQIAEREMELVVVSEKKLLFYNYFEYNTKEDFLYYLLFSLEQLGLDREQVQLRLFGQIEAEDELFQLCHTYIKNVSVFIPPHDFHWQEPSNEESIDFSVLNSL